MEIFTQIDFQIELGNPRHGGPEKKGGTTPHKSYQYHYHRLFLIVTQIGPLNAYQE